MAIAIGFTLFSTIAIVLFGEAIKIRSHESMYKTDRKNEARRIRATNFAFAK